MNQNCDLYLIPEAIVGELSLSVIEEGEKFQTITEFLKLDYSRDRKKVQLLEKSLEAWEIELWADSSRVTTTSTLSLIAKSGTRERIGFLVSFSIEFQRRSRRPKVFRSTWFFDSIDRAFRAYNDKTDVRRSLFDRVLTHLSSR
jgi:hypothetical protein